MSASVPLPFVHWAYTHDGVEGVALATTQPTAANCFLIERGIDPASLVAIPLTDRSSFPKDALPVPCCWMWRKKGTWAWTIGHVQPDPHSAHFLRHPEEYVELTIRQLYFFDRYTVRGT